MDGRTKPSIHDGDPLYDECHSIVRAFKYLSLTQLDIAFFMNKYTNLCTNLPPIIGPRSNTF